MARLDDAQPSGKEGVERIAKTISRSGLCSRRDAEVLIEEGRVTVNGAPVSSAALDVRATDIVFVDGKPIAKREAPRLWRYHKPKGRVTTHKDPEGRPTVFEALPDNLPRTISVGRLDFNTEGLLLLTNDGDLARHMELPSTGWARRYRIRAYGAVEQAALDALSEGVTIERVNYGPIEARLERDQGDNVWIAMLIREGKNREVRRIVEHLGLTVNRLIRVSFGPFILGDLEPGQVEEVKTRVLQDQLGPRLAKQMGVHREPLREERRLPVNARNGGDPRKTYLRRKAQDAPALSPPASPAADERPPFVQRRRILPLDAASGDPARIEDVKEKPRPRFGAGGKRSQGDAGRSRASGERRDDNKPQSAGTRFDGGAERPRREERPVGAGGVYSGAPAGERAPRKFERPADDKRPARSFTPRGDGDAARPRREEPPRSGSAYSGGLPGERTPRRFERPADDGRPRRAFTPHADGEGDRSPRREYQREGRGDATAVSARVQARKFERTSEGGRPTRSFTARSGSGANSPQREDKPRAEGREFRPASRGTASSARTYDGPPRGSFEPRLDAGVEERPSRGRDSQRVEPRENAAPRNRTDSKFRAGGDNGRSPRTFEPGAGATRSPRTADRTPARGGAGEVPGGSAPRKFDKPRGPFEPRSDAGADRLQRNAQPPGNAPAGAGGHAFRKFDPPRDGGRHRPDGARSRPPIEERPGSELRAGGRSGFRDGGQRTSKFRGSKPETRDGSTGAARGSALQDGAGDGRATKRTSFSGGSSKRPFVGARSERANGDADTARPGRSFESKQGRDARQMPGKSGKPAADRVRDGGSRPQGQGKPGFRGNRDDGKTAAAPARQSAFGRKRADAPQGASPRADRPQGSGAERSGRPGGFQKRAGLDRTGPGNRSGRKPDAAGAGPRTERPGGAARKPRSAPGSPKAPDSETP